MQRTDDWRAAGEFYFDQKFVISEEFFSKIL